MLFISHDLDVVEYLCDRIVVLYLGRVMEIAPATALYRAPLHPYTQALLAASPRPDPDARRARRLLQGDIPSPVESAVGLRVPHPLPARAGRLRGNGAAAARGRAGPLQGLPARRLGMRCDLAIDPRHDLLDARHQGLSARHRAAAGVRRSARRAGTCWPATCRSRMAVIKRDSALAHNHAWMRDFTARHRASLLAPHGKTTMAPQIFAQQLAAGAWGITVATVQQLARLRALRRAPRA